MVGLQNRAVSSALLAGSTWKLAGAQIHGPAAGRVPKHLSAGQIHRRRRRSHGRRDKQHQQGQCHQPAYPDVRSMGVLALVAMHGGFSLWIRPAPRLPGWPAANVARPNFSTGQEKCPASLAVRASAVIKSSPCQSLPPPTGKTAALLDSSSGRKLERFGPVTLIRPEAQATWPPASPQRRWDAARPA